MSRVHRIAPSTRGEADGETSDRLVAGWLRALPSGKGSALFCDDVDEGLAAVSEASATIEPPRTVVTLQWTHLPRLREELAQAADALAGAAATLYPSLYESAGQRRRAAQGPRGRQSAKVRARIPGVIAGAARRILSACSEGKIPALRDLPPADQVRQLALALDPDSLVVLLAAQARDWSEGTLLSFARGAEWLATNARATVVLVLPAALINQSALDGVAYRALHLEATVPTNAGPEATAPGEPAKGAESAVGPEVSIAPVLGKPHPGSETERRLHGKIIADAELGALFRFNQLVDTGYGNTPRVDLLWPEGRLVVEVDSHPLHSRRQQFFLDRDRDFRLLLCGYRVCRIDDYEIIADTDRVVEKLRQLVRLLRKGAP